MHAEAVATLAASVFSRHWGTEQVQVESDALMVIAAIQNEETSFHGYYGHLFTDIH